jgi:two-component system, OmpR family, phosphate regulon sensor histidine kinase PhoR
LAFFLRYLAAIGLVLLAAWLLAGFVSPSAAIVWLGIAFSTHALIGAAHLARLRHWASLPRNRELPAGLGPWREAFDRLGRFVREEADSQGELRAELSRIHSAVDQLPDGLVVLDRFDHVVWANSAAESLHGIFGSRRPIHHFIRQPEFTAMMTEAGAPSLVRLQLAPRPGRTFEIRVHPSTNGQKLLISRDITEQAKLDAMRSDFVANVSHEIRTPVTVIGGFAETMLTLDLEESERRQYLESILRHSTTLQTLVNDLLTLSSLEAGVNRPDDESIDLHAMLGALLDEARALSGGRHSISLSLDGPRQVRGIRPELESAARNLLTNAIRYTPEGGTIAIDWRIRAGQGWLSVRDSGIGIAAEHLPRLGERFYRVERGRSRSSGGTGLGLAIARRIMLRHQGSLDIESSPGRGSTFSLRLPATRLIEDSSSGDAAG